MQQHWYLLENDDLGLENHWMPSGLLEEALKREVGRPLENDDRELFNLK